MRQFVQSGRATAGSVLGLRLTACRAGQARWGHRLPLASTSGSSRASCEPRLRTAPGLWARGLTGETARHPAHGHGSVTLPTSEGSGRREPDAEPLRLRLRAIRGAAVPFGSIVVISVAGGTGYTH
jgi:hypothetical protein